MNIPILLDTIVCFIGMGLVIYYGWRYDSFAVKMGCAITFVGLGFQLSRNFGYLSNTFQNTIFDYGYPIWAFKELGLVVLLIALLFVHDKKRHR